MTVEVNADRPEDLNFFAAEYQHHYTDESPSGLPSVVLRYHRLSDLPDGYTFHQHKLLACWGGTAITALLFLTIVFRQDWREVWYLLRRLLIWILPLALLYYLTGIMANAARFVGLMHFTNHEAINPAPVILDRLVSLNVFLTVLPLSILTFGSPAAWLATSINFTRSLFALAMAATQSQRMGGFLGRVRDWVARGREEFCIWLEQPRLLILAFCVSLLSIFVISLAIWLVATGLGFPVSLYQVIGITDITHLLILLPISGNDYGLRQVAITALYLPLSASLEQVPTLAIITCFLSMLETLPGGLWLSRVVSDPKWFGWCCFRKAPIFCNRGVNFA